jgi:hypothetical protein
MKRALATIHVVLRGGRTVWAMVYSSDFFADAKYATAK